MFFDDWKTKSQRLTVSERLFWEYDMSHFDWKGMRVIVMQRIIERGTLNDLYAAISLYDGVDNVKEIIKDIPVLSNKDMNFVIAFFNLKKEDLKCYIRKQLREKHLNS